MQEKDTKAIASKNQKGKKKNVFASFFGGVANKAKEIFSELKKVSWPTFGKVVKQLGVVLLVVVLFLVVITAADFGLQQLLKLLQGTL